DNPFPSLVLHKGTRLETWAQVQQWTGSLTDSERAAQRVKLVDYLPLNDTVAVRGLNLPAQRSRERISPAPFSYRYNRCAVVGDSGGLLSTELGALIDNHAAVLRFNAAPTSHYETHVGRKSTFRLYNGKSVAALLKKDAHRILDRARPQMLLWRPETFHQYPQIKRRLSESVDLQLLRPEFLQRVIDVYYAVYDRMRRSGMIQADVIEPKSGAADGDRVAATMEAIKVEAAMRMASPDDAAARVPTSFVGIYLMMHLCKRVNLFGFDPVSVQEHIKELGITTPTYYDNKDFISLAPDDPPLGANQTDRSSSDRVWRGLRGERFPGGGTQLGGGGFDYALLRLWEIYGLLKICTTVAPEQCLESYKVL
ncbi:hypothetical protein CYMTET_35753, partial [Cymbomonas tetramitiformis]